eukprot:scaffold2442_cov146-Cylindrotheca_fusiformis.AAC.6
MPHSGTAILDSRISYTAFRMSEEPTAEVSDPMDDAMEEVDEETRKQLEKIKRAQELREQEVELPADWRCPVCRASKDAFEEVVEEIPGFEVNQGYGFGSNAWTAGQKNLAIFGGLGFFFLLFLSGYALS